MEARSIKGALADGVNSTEVDARTTKGALANGAQTTDVEARSTRYEQADGTNQTAQLLIFILFTEYIRCLSIYS